MAKAQVNIFDFEQAVRADPAVTANLLAAANSAYYRGMELTTTVHEAVSRIGLRRMYEVAIGASFRRTLPLRMPGYGLNADGFWLHCSAVAVFSEALGREVNLPSSEIAFTAGLLHDVGKLVICGFMDMTMPESNWWAFGSASKERELLGTNHCEVGEAIAVQWSLPQSIAATCRWHHDCGSADTYVDFGLLAVIHTADFLAYQAGFPGSSGDGDILDPLVVNRLGLVPKQLDRLVMEYKDEVLKMNKVTASSDM
jgi:putative nucleotidyltransferase with HDIG domain